MVNAPLHNATGGRHECKESLTEKGAEKFNQPGAREGIVEDHRAPRKRSISPQKKNSPRHKNPNRLRDGALAFQESRFRWGKPKIASKME